MKKNLLPPNLDLMRNAIDLHLIPYSDRGSRLMIFQDENDQFMVKLAERLIHVEPGIESYLHRPPFFEKMILVDKDGLELNFKVTWIPQGIILTTNLGEFHLLINSYDDLVIGFPSDVIAGIRLQINHQVCKVSENDGKVRTVKDFSYKIQGEVLTNRIWTEDCAIQIEILMASKSESCIIFRISENNETLPMADVSYKSILESNRERWQDWFSQVPPVNDRFQAAYTYSWWNMANNLIRPKGKVLYEAMMPSKVKYVGLWLWDCAMHAIAFRHVDPQLARNQLRAMLAWQQRDGMLPDAIFDEGIVCEIDFPIHAKVTKPPILAWAAWKIHEVAPDMAFIKEIYPQLVRENHWWFNDNDDDRDGIVQYNHPYSSGLDDNPLWDFGMPVESPDLNTYLCLQMDALAKMAEELGLFDEAEKWKTRSDKLVDRMIEHLWDENAGVFQFLVNHKAVPVLTPFNLFPLWTGRLPVPIRERLLQHLQDPNEFWGSHSLPTVAYNDPHFDADIMWRGPVWVNINYFMIEALQKNGEYELARDLRKKTLQLIVEQGGMFEYYNAKTGEPPGKAARVFGWTAAVFIDLAIQESLDFG